MPGHGISHDIDLFAWFLRYEATAIAHGRLPDLVTTALNAPQGVSLMWNTSFLLPGVLFAPLTLVAGPQATLTTLLTLGFAGSAAAMFWVLRRWGASLPAAALGGTIFGFSPAMRIAAVGHSHLQFAVLLPLIIDALLRLVTGRGRQVRTGAWLGLLTAAQLFIAEEEVALTACAGLVIIVVLAAARPRHVPGLVRGAMTGLATAAGVLLVTAGYPLWVQFHGPLSERGSPWSPGHFRNRPGDFVTGPSGFLFHSQAMAHYLDRHAVRFVEYLAYLGWPMLVVLLVAAVRFWGDLRVRALAVTFAALEVFSLGSRTVVAGGLHYPAAMLPWHYLQALPLLNQSLPNRFSLLADGAAAVVLAFALDLAWGGPGNQTPGDDPSRRRIARLTWTTHRRLAHRRPRPAEGRRPGAPRPGHRAYHPAAHAGHSDQAHPGRLGSGLHPAAPGHRRASPRGAGPARDDHALAGRHRCAHLGNQRLLHRS